MSAMRCLRLGVTAGPSVAPAGPAAARRRPRGARRQRQQRPQRVVEQRRRQGWRQRQLGLQLLHEGRQCGPEAPASVDAQHRRHGRVGQPAAPTPARPQSRTASAWRCPSPESPRTRRRSSSRAAATVSRRRWTSAGGGCRASLAGIVVSRRRAGQASKPSPMPGADGRFAYPRAPWPMPDHNPSAPTRRRCAAC